MSDKHYAHTREGQSRESWHLLEEHLQDTARKASEHASAFGSDPWGDLAGRWHDLGKYADDFQSYLLSFATEPEDIDISLLSRNPGRVDHSSAGAVHVLDRCKDRLIGSDKDELPPAEAALAMVIAGHHSGLPEKLNFEAGRLTEKQSRLGATRPGAPADLLGLEIPPLPTLLRPESFTAKGGRTERCLRYELWTRMLFSALIDADRLDTERFMDPKNFAARERSKLPADVLKTLLARVESNLEKVSLNARAEAAKLPEAARSQAEAVLKLRSEVLDACRQAAERPPGRHTLTVPTGGGKTLAAMAFALKHAILHGLRRVIVVIPYTSIIDQTASVYRKAFGDDLAEAIIEHQSNLDPSRETIGNRLASENWDAPVIVTTSVQFFESLFSRRGTAARKLHNIARSVVVFDEVQTLPHHLRAPIFDVLNQLVDHYGVSALFCTATQPALELKELNRQGFPHLTDIQEVVPDVAAAFEAVKRRVVADFARFDVATTWEQLASEVKGHDRVLVIVQRRDDARDLCRLLPTDTFHLSALMCAAHRREVLDRIKAVLKAGQTCRVISTTLVEAGVDLDFPVVYRALGGIDALAQAAGRCNREGRLLDAEGKPIPGRLIVFKAPLEPPQGLRRGAETTGILLKMGEQLDLFDPETYQTYFNLYLADSETDAHGVMTSRLARDFPEVEARFRMIDDQGQVSVVVPFVASVKRIKAYRAKNGRYKLRALHVVAARRIEAYRAKPSRDTLRALQPCLVNISTCEANVLASQIEVIHDQVRWLKPGALYDPRYGLIVDEIAPPQPPGKLIC